MAGHVDSKATELGATIKLGMFNQGLLPGGSGLDVPVGSSAPAPSEATAADGGSPLRVYTIVVDGFNPQEVGPHTPMLSELKGQGTWYEQARAVLPAETLPNHAAMMTGVVPGRNGIIANQFWRDQQPEEYMQYPEFLDADTLTTRLEHAYGGAISTATVLSKEYLYGIFLGESVGAPRPQRQADFHWDPRSQPAYVISPSDHALDGASMDAFLGWIRQSPALPQFAMVNLGDVDRAGHADEAGVVTAAVDRSAHPGEDELSATHVSPLRQAAIEQADTQIRRLVEELKLMGAWDETVLIVLSDHGMDWGPQDQWIRTIDALRGAGYTGGGPKDPVPGGDFHAVGGGGSELIYVRHDLDIAPMAEILCGLEGVAFIATREPVAGLPPDCRNTLAEVGIDHPRSPEIEVFTEPGWHSSPQAGSSGGALNPLPGNHGHSVSQHSTLLVAGGHPVLRDQAESVEGETVYRRNSFAPPAGGPGVLSVAPTVASLFGIGEPPGGYAVPPLTGAFDPGALEARGSGLPSGLPADAGRPRPRDGLVTTLRADRDAVTYGERFTLSGRVSGAPGCGGPLRVTLYKSPAGGGRATEVIATSISVRADGSWSNTLRSRPSAQYHAGVQPTESCEGSVSAPVSVPVHVRVKLARPCRGGDEVRGRVLPRSPRTRVVLERVRPGADRRVARDRIDRSSRFELRPPACRGRYRVVWPRQGDANATGAAEFRVGGKRR